ncbi:MAG: hypothetical protein V3T72_06885 [Thermoanaerobaculia bacterium]
MDSSPPTPAAEEPAGELQFDRADFGEAAPAGTQQCTLGGETITGAYYQINGAVACEACYAQAVASRTGGSGVGRFARATYFGVLGGAVGAGIYYGIVALTGYNIGLIAILVGFLVGSGVRIGSRHCGGWFYQLLAVGITYCAIVSTYVPQLVDLWRQSAEQAIAEASGETSAGDDGTVAEPPAGLFAESAEPTAPEFSEDEEFPEDAVPEMAWVAWMVAIVAAFFAPVIMGFAGNFIGILIIAFSLWEAWRINRQQPFEVSGPYQVAGAES